MWAGGHVKPVHDLRVRVGALDTASPTRAARRSTGARLLCVPAPAAALPAPLDARRARFASNGTRSACQRPRVCARRPWRCIGEPHEPASGAMHRPRAAPAEL